MSGKSGSIPSSDLDPNLPRNKAESDAMKHSLEETPAQRYENDQDARAEAQSLFQSIFGGKK